MAYPVICPVLYLQSLSCFILRFGMKSTRHSMLQVNMCRWMQFWKGNVCTEEHYDEFTELGLYPEYFGTCSIFKDLITHEACRVVIDIPLQPYLEDVSSDEWVHAIWIARNENVSHSVCGPDFIGKRFAKSCPYFDSSQYEEAYKEERYKELDQWIHSMMLESCSPETFWLFQFCVDFLVG